MTLDALNAMIPDDATATLSACCGSSRWVAGVIARRPFETIDDLLDASDDVWWLLGPDDWQEAFAHHPRIGEQASATQQGERARTWSTNEQSSVTQADASTRAELAQVNKDYEQRFGFIYIVCASGKSPAELLDIARERMHNSRDAELRVAAEEQRKITRLRLEKLLRPSQEPAS
jgi:OHCU decarboxylase